MSKIVGMLSVSALFLAGGAAAQTYPATYGSIPQLSFPLAGDSQPTLATDFIFGARLQGGPGDYSVGDYGPLPITDFAFAADVAKTNAAVASALGGGASVNASGALTPPSYLVQGNTYANVGAALAAEDSTVATLSTSVSSLSTGFAALTDRVGALQRFAVDARREARQGIAAAMAMSSASMPSAPGRTSWVVNASDFRDEQAVGGSFAHRFGTSFPLAVTAGFAISVSGSGEKGGRVGLAGEF